MTKFYRTAKKEDADGIASGLKKMGYNVQILPYKSGGTNQPAYRQIQVVGGGTTADELRRSRKLRETKFNWW